MMISGTWYNQQAAAPGTERRPVRVMGLNAWVAPAPSRHQRLHREETEVTASKELHDGQERWIELQERGQPECSHGDPDQDRGRDTERQEEG
jgi:hypothetical protein